jgi:hypothetical protein
MISPFRRWYAVVPCLIALASLTLSAQAQTPDPVWTWHNDNGRTGQYLSEISLTATGSGSVSQSTFGLVGQYSVQGQVYAQPLAVGNVSVQDHTHCPSPCNLVFIATEQDMLYAFNADPLVSTAAIWSTDLAAQAAPGGTAVDCTLWQPPCAEGVIYPSMGVTGTPVIDVASHTVFVVSLVQVGGGPPNGHLYYYLHAIDITNGHGEGHPHCDQRYGHGAGSHRQVRNGGRWRAGYV